MVTTFCTPLIKGVVMRATRLDACGHPLCGPTNAVVSKGFTQIAATANVEDGAEFLVRLADGTLCINEKDASQLKRFDIQADFCRVDPALFELMSQQEPVLDWEGNTVGFRTGDVDPDGAFALEVWTKVAGDTGCDTEGATGNWGYVLYPRIVNGILGDLTIDNGPVTFSLKGNTKKNPGWCQGPWDVVPQVAGAHDPGPLLVAIGQNQRHLEITTVAPPDDTCGYVAVPCLDGDIDGTPAVPVPCTPGTPAVPVVGSLTPATGPAAGGTLVRIAGLGFTTVTGATGVKFGATNATSYDVLSDTLIEAIAPAHAAGSVAVTVTNTTGVSTVTQNYIYT